jgi:hypothetical protein
MGNYLTVGHMEDGILVELSPKKRARVTEARSGRELAPDNPQVAHAINETVAYYQVASDILRGR